MSEQSREQIIQGQIWRKSKVIAYVQISSSEIDRREKNGQFPARIKIGIRAVGWRASDVIAYVESLGGVHITNSSVLPGTSSGPFPSSDNKRVTAANGNRGAR